ncbi:MAG: translation elongation factor Ts [Spirochaetes bacterium]|nr:translation elongation factor Ts [Spirochaetota bacterium]
MDISADMVKELRDSTGAGMMECKKALLETGGDMEAAVKYLRERGIAKATLKSHRETSEGIISSYIHAGNKVGVMIELSCETDFVARTDEFKTLGKDLCMQIAASNPKYISRDNIPEDVLSSEKDIFRKQAKQEGKPDKMLDKIAEGKLGRFFSEVCLMEQPFIKDTDKSIEDVIKLAISKFGENIQVKRFIRFEVGVE